MSSNEIESNWLTTLPETDELRMKSKKQLISRLNGKNENLVEVKNLEAAIKIVGDDYNKIVSSIQDRFKEIESDASDDDYEKLKNSYYQISSGNGNGGKTIFVFELYINSGINGENELSETEYKFYNFKESNATIRGMLSSIVRDKKIRLE
jgi:hypothetical protein